MWSVVAGWTTAPGSPTHRKRTGTRMPTVRTGSISRAARSHCQPECLWQSCCGRLTASGMGTPAPGLMHVRAVWAAAAVCHCQPECSGLSLWVSWANPPHPPPRVLSQLQHEVLPRCQCSCDIRLPPPTVPGTGTGTGWQVTSATWTDATRRVPLDVRGRMT